MDVVRAPATGWIEVIVGSMFSGKSEELIRRLRRAQIATQRVQTFKPSVDTRFGDHHIVSHSDTRLPAETTATAADLLERVRVETEVVGIDEGQFFDADLPAACAALAARGVRVIVAGLDQDYLGQPFEPMPQLLAVAEFITKTRAICMVCGNPANHTQRLVGSSARVLLGSSGAYEARCRRCFDPALAEREQRRQAQAAGGAAPSPDADSEGARPLRGSLASEQPAQETGTVGQWIAEPRRRCQPDE